MEIKIRIFQRDDMAQQNVQQVDSHYFFTVTGDSFPEKEMLDKFLRVANFPIQATTYDPRNGIGIVTLDWPLSPGSGDIELSSQQDGAGLINRTIHSDPDHFYLLSLTAFYDLLESHDWYFEQSDEREQYVQGLMDLAIIERQAMHGGADYQAVLDDYKDYMFSGQEFGTDQLPKPLRPLDASPYKRSILEKVSVGVKAPLLESKGESVNLSDEKARKSKPTLH